MKFVSVNFKHIELDSFQFFSLKLYCMKRQDYVKISIRRKRVVLKSLIDYTLSRHQKLMLFSKFTVKRKFSKKKEDARVRSLC